MGTMKPAEWAKRSMMILSCAFCACAPKMAGGTAATPQPAPSGPPGLFDLVALTDAPAAGDISEVRISDCISGDLSEDQFLEMMTKMTPLAPDDPLLADWHYAPRCTVRFNAKGGDFSLQLFLGGLGFLTQPGGKKSAVRFFE